METLPVGLFLSVILVLAVREARERARKRKTEEWKVRARQNLDRAMRGDWMAGQ